MSTTTTNNNNYIFFLLYRDLDREIESRVMVSRFVVVLPFMAIFNFW